MKLEEALVSVWRQVLVERRDQVTLGAQRARVGRTRNLGLATVAFSFGDHAVEGIEQNPNTQSRWAKLAQEGKRVMQFSCRGRYFANVCEGKLMRYPAWKGLGLPE